MSAYNPPTKVSTLFNSNNFESSNSNTSVNVVVQAPTISVKDVTTVEPTNNSTTLGQATASITGNSPNYSLNLGIPAGIQGIQGLPGITPTFTPTGVGSTLDVGSKPTVTVISPSANNYTPNI